MYNLIGRFLFQAITKVSKFYSYLYIYICIYHKLCQNSLVSCCAVWTFSSSIAVFRMAVFRSQLIHHRLFGNLNIKDIQRDHLNQNGFCNMPAGVGYPCEF